MRHFLLLILSVWLVASCKPNRDESSLIDGVRGNYLGQILPDTIPQIFAPGIVNTGKFTRDITMTPEGDEIWFSICGHSFSFSVVLYTRRTNEGWTKPQIAPFVKDFKYKYIEPFISPDGKYLYFVSNQPEQGDGEAKDMDIWRCLRVEDGWGEAENIGAPVNTPGDEFFPSLTAIGTIYYTSETKGREGVILKARSDENRFAAPDSLPQEINCGVARFNAFIAPDESFLIQGVWGLPDSYGGTDHYIFFRNEEGQWSKAVNMGNQVNSEGRNEYAATLSPDGHYLFFMSDRVLDEKKPQGSASIEGIETLYKSGGTGLSSVYWMKADIIEKLRQKAEWD